VHVFIGFFFGRIFSANGGSLPFILPLQGHFRPILGTATQIRNKIKKKKNRYNDKKKDTRIRKKTKKKKIKKK
jgi:hypothetical protein